MHEAPDAVETRWPRLVLIGLCLLMWLPGFFTLPPTDRDESRFAQATKQMIETGDYVRIMNGDVPRNLKPIGIYWLQLPFAAAARAAGLATANPIWPYRLPSLLGGIVAVLATFEAGLVLADRRRALLAAGMLASCIVLATETHLAKTDAVLLGTVTVCMAVLARTYRGLPLGWRGAATFWAAMGVGVLVKGPITPMVAGLAVLTLAVWERRARWLLALQPLPGVLLLLAIVLPWFVAIGFATHGAFFHDSVGGDLGRKLASGDDAHGAPPGYHLLLLPLLCFPATLPVLASLPSWWRRRLDPGARFLLAWAVPSWIVFEATPTKLPHYTLPLYPAVFLLACLALPIGRSLWARRIAPGVAILAASVLAVAAALVPIAAGAPPLLGLPAAAAAALVGWLAVQPSRPALAIAAMPLFTIALLGFELPGLQPLWLAPRVARDAAGQTVAVAGFHEPSLVFLAGTRTLLAPTGAAAADALASGRAAVAAVAAADLASFQAEAAHLGLPVTARTEEHGLNYSRGRRTDLTLFEKSAD